MGTTAHLHPRRCRVLVPTQPPLCVVVSVSGGQWREWLEGPEHEQCACYGTLFVFGWRTTSRKRKMWGRGGRVLVHI